MSPGPSWLRSSHLPALVFADLDGPFCHASNINREVFLWHAGFFQRQRGKLAVLAVSSGAIDHDTPGVLADRQHCRKMFLRIVSIKLVRSGNMTFLVMSVVAGIDKHDQFLIILRIVKE